LLIFFVVETWGGYWRVSWFEYRTQ
jgi:hypothetical protein